jgi:hypothetical protein
MRFWLANLTGVLVVTPFLLLLATSRRTRIRWLEALEAVVLFGLLVFAGLVVFGGRFPSDIKTYPLEFVLVPFLLWTAFRFGRREMAILMVVLSAIVIWGTLKGYGPFARPIWDESMVLVQAYICVMAITGIVLAAVVAEHKHAEVQLREMATTDPLTGRSERRRYSERSMPATCASRARIAPPWRTHSTCPPGCAATMSPSAVTSRRLMAECVSPRSHPSPPATCRLQPAGNRASISLVVRPDHSPTSISRNSGRATSSSPCALATGSAVSRARRRSLE